MGGHRVIAPLWDARNGRQVNPGQALPEHLAGDPAALARLRRAGCLAPAPAADTPGLVEPAANAASGQGAPPAAVEPPAKPARGRRRG
jgi:hypothetical protein